MVRENVLFCTKWYDISSIQNIIYQVGKYGQPKPMFIVFHVLWFGTDLLYSRSKATDVDSRTTYRLRTAHID